MRTARPGEHRRRHRLLARRGRRPLREPAPRDRLRDPLRRGPHAGVRRRQPLHPRPLPAQPRALPASVENPAAPAGERRHESDADADGVRQRLRRRVPLPALPRVPPAHPRDILAAVRPARLAGAAEGRTGRARRPRAAPRLPQVDAGPGPGALRRRPGANVEAVRRAQGGPARRTRPLRPVLPRGTAEELQGGARQPVRHRRHVPVQPLEVRRGRQLPRAAALPGQRRRRPGAPAHGRHPGPVPAARGDRRGRRARRHPVRAFHARGQEAPGERSPRREGGHVCPGAAHLGDQPGADRRVDGGGDADGGTRYADARGDVLGAVPHRGQPTGLRGPLRPLSRDAGGRRRPVCGRRRDRPRHPARGRPARRLHRGVPELPALRRRLRPHHRQPRLHRGGGGTDPQPVQVDAERTRAQRVRNRCGGRRRRGVGGCPASALLRLVPAHRRHARLERLPARGRGVEEERVRAPVGHPVRRGHVRVREAPRLVAERGMGRQAL